MFAAIIPFLAKIGALAAKGGTMAAKGAMAAGKAGVAGAKAVGHGAKAAGGFGKSMLGKMIPHGAKGNMLQAGISKMGSMQPANDLPPIDPNNPPPDLQGGVEKGNPWLKDLMKKHLDSVLGMGLQNLMGQNPNHKYDALAQGLKRPPDIGQSGPVEMAPIGGPGGRQLVPTQPLMDPRQRRFY